MNFRKTCVLLDDNKLKNLNYDILTAMESTSKVEARRNAGYIYAIRHGARHIFDAYPETYIAAKIQIEVLARPYYVLISLFHLFFNLVLCVFHFKVFKREMLRQLQNVALNVALGVVSERPYVKRVQNPYAHFGRPELWTEGFRRNNQRFIHNHIYRICEVRPPSIEKVYPVSSINHFICCIGHGSMSNRIPIKITGSLRKIRFSCIFFLPWRSCMQNRIEKLFCNIRLVLGRCRVELLSNGTRLIFLQSAYSVHTLAFPHFLNLPKLITNFK